MMVIELREAAKDKAFGLIDEIKDLGRKKKMALCELEETLYECFESTKDDEDEYEDEDEMELGFRGRRGYRHGMRKNRNYDEYEDDDYEGMRMRSNRNMRMRRANRSY